MMADKAGLELETLAGMAYDPLSGLWRMTENTGVNYIAYFQKSGLVTSELPAAVLLKVHTVQTSDTGVKCIAYFQKSGLVTGKLPARMMC